MKKFIAGLILSISFLSPTAFIYAGGGDSFAGGLAGGMVGGLVSGAMTKDSSGRRAEQKVDAMTREQQYDRYVSQKSSLNLLVIVLIIMFLAIIGLGFMVFKKK